MSGRHTGTLAGRHADKQTNRQAIGKQAKGRQAARQAYTQTHKHIKTNANKQMQHRTSKTHEDNDKKQRDKQTSR